MKINCRLKASSGCLRKEAYVYPVVVDAGRIDGGAFVDAVVGNCNITRGTVLAVLSGVLSELMTFLSLGHSVEVPDVGVFSLKVRGKVRENKNGNKVIEGGRLSVQFTPRSVMRRELDEASLRVVSGRVAESVVMTEEKALEKSAELLDETGFFVCRQFADYTGISLSASYIVLDGLAAAGLLRKCRAGGINAYCRSS